MTLARYRSTQYASGRRYYNGCDRVRSRATASLQCKAGRLHEGLLLSALWDTGV